MAFDPIQEDCLRLILELLRREHIYPLDNAAVIERGMTQYQRDPNALVKTDRDRSFHLVAKAAELADYRVPFLTDEDQINKEDDRAEAILREAVELDPKNWDARRMLTAICANSNDEYVSYLLDNRAAVEHDIEKLVESADNPYDEEYAQDLGKRPYLRWLAALSSRALIAGQYKLSLDAARDLLEIAPDDPADVRYTAMLALAKLECDIADLKAFKAEHPRAFAASPIQSRRPDRSEPRQDAWSLLAQINVLYRAFDFEGASHVLRLLLRTYPHTSQALFYQAEFPDGLYARVNVMPGSQDELILAISEATPLLQEGLGAPENAGFAVWLANHELVQSALDEDVAQLSAMVNAARKRGNN